MIILDLKKDSWSFTSVISKLAAKVEYMNLLTKSLFTTIPKKFDLNIIKSQTGIDLYTSADHT